jgi:hypothetical protein
MTSLIFDIHVFMHRDIIYKNDQQDAPGVDNLLFLGCTTCFDRYFCSLSGASKLYYSFWYYTRMLLLAGIMGVLELMMSVPTGTDGVSSNTPIRV